MKNAVNLVKMTLMNLWSIKKFPLLIIGVYVILSLINETFITMLFGMVVFLTLYQIMVYEDGYSTDTLISYLPVKGNEYVLARFLFSIICIIMATVIFSICHMIPSVLNIQSVAVYSYTAILSSGIISAVLAISIAMPILCKLGLKNGRIVLMIVMMSGMFIPGLILEEYGEMFAKIVNIFSNGAMGIVLTVALSVVILGISYVISCGIYKNKELL